MEIPRTRTCRVCQIEKPLEDFTPHKQSLHGRQRRCKACAAKARRDRYGSDELERAKQRIAYTSRGRANALYQGAKKRAANKGLPLGISIDWLEQKLSSGRCETTGLPFVLTPGHPQAPSIDRINSSLGYTKENTRLVLWFYNRAKGATSDDEALRLIDQIADRRRDPQG